MQTDEFRPGVKLTLKNFIKNYDIWEDDLTKISHVDLAMKILEESGYIQSLKIEKSLESEGRLENLKELVNAMSAFDNMIGFLEHIALVNDSDAEHKDGQISLMTLHSAKGLEFSAVFLPCWEEGSFPSQRSIDEKGKEGFIDFLKSESLLKQRKVFEANQLLVHIKSSNNLSLIHI